MAVVEYEKQNEGTSSFRDGWVLKLSSEEAGLLYSGLVAYRKQLWLDLEAVHFNENAYLERQDTPEGQPPSMRLSGRADTRPLEDEMFLTNELARTTRLMFDMIDACGNDPRAY